MNPESETEENPAESPDRMTESNLLNISRLSGLAWVILGALLIYFWQDGRFLSVLTTGDPIWLQLIAGTITGLIFGYIASGMIHTNSFRPLFSDFKVVQVVKDADLSDAAVNEISFTAGTTEEWLFRGAIQPLLGIWITSILFVAVHGYFRFKSRMHIIFGVFMLLLSLCLGLLFQQIGLISAMAAHVVYDIVVMRSLRGVKL